MNIKDLNIKLMLAFEAMLIHGNVTAAAESLDLTQPAMSVCLSKLRKLFNDPLFVRTSHGMEPTPLATELDESILGALHLLRQTLNRNDRFDPSVSTRTFHIIMTDIGARVHLPPLLKHLSRVAPGVNLHAVQLPVKQIRETLESGEMDLAVGFIPALSTGYYQQRFYKRSYVCIARRDHPVIGDTLSLTQYLAASHVVVSAPGTGHDVVESVLLEKGYNRRIALHVSHFLAIPRIVASTDLIVTIPTMLAESYMATNHIKILEPPLRFPEYAIAQYWHSRFHKDPGNRWMREQLYSLFQDNPPALPQSATQPT